MIVALGHESYVGKDTFAMFIIDYLRTKFRQLRINNSGFADLGYQLCTNVYGWAGFQNKVFYTIHPEQKEVILPKIGKTPRDLLIGVLEKLREFDDNVWLNARLNTSHLDYHLDIITDLRKVAEFIRCMNLDIMTVYIHRPGYESNRISDVDLRPYRDKFKVKIDNNGDLKDFRLKAIEFADKYIVPSIQEKMRNAA